MVINEHDPMIESTLIENYEEIKELQRFATGIVVDVGANVGSHAINFARTAEVVYAFEPHPLSYYTLCANLLLNRVQNVAPFNRALGATNGTEYMPNFDPTKPNTAMGCQIGNGSQPVTMSTLDSLEIRGINFMKIDVEAYELEVLKGAIETLKRENMVVYVEIHKEELAAPIHDLMAACGYNDNTLFEVLTDRQVFEATRPTYKYHTVDEKEGYHLFDQKRMEDGGYVVLTTGHLYWKEGRITWVGP